MGAGALPPGWPQAALLGCSAAPGALGGCAAAGAQCRLTLGSLISQRDSSRFMRSELAGASRPSSSSCSVKGLRRNRGATAHRVKMMEAVSGMERSSSRGAGEGGRQGGWAEG